MGIKRLTVEHWQNLDPWEFCGQDGYCTRNCHEPGGCANGCIVPKLYASLAAYEEADVSGRLIILPCKVGDTVYRLIKTKDGSAHIAPATVSGIHLGDTERNYRYKNKNEYIVLRVDGNYCAHIDAKKLRKRGMSMPKNKGIYRLFRTKQELDRYEEEIRHHTRVNLMDHVTLALGRMGFREAKFREFDAILTQVISEYTQDFIDDFNVDKEMVYSRSLMERELQQYTGKFYAPEEERYK